MIYESVINISAGNSIAKYKNVVSCITSSESLINTHFDVDHNRAVFTFASHDFDLVKKGAKKLINSSFENIDIITHSGVHPQICLYFSTIMLQSNIILCPAQESTALV